MFAAALNSQWSDTDRGGGLLPDRGGLRVEIETRTKLKVDVFASLADSRQADISRGQNARVSLADESDTSLVVRSEKRRPL